MIEDGDPDVLFGEDHKLPEIVDDSKKKAGAASGNTSVQPASDDAIYNWLDVIPKKRLDASGDKHLLFNQLVGQAKEWDVEQQLGESLSKINTYETDSPRFREAIFLFKRLQRSQEIHLGKDHTALAVTEMLIGMCQQEVRDFQTSAKTLRNAIVRFQQSEEADVNTFIECLCALSDSYNELDNFDASRTCIKQAYRLLTDDAPQRLQVRVLEALANVLMDEERFRQATTTFERVLRMKSQILKTEHTDVVRPLIGLGICRFAVRDMDKAERHVRQAAEMYHALGYDDRHLQIQILETLSGILRHQRQFVLADHVAEYALELQGHLDKAGGHAMYGTLLNEAVAAEAQGDFDVAKRKYREALSALELQRKKRDADRLKILCRLYIHTTAKQAIQRTSLMAEIEDAATAVFSGSITDVKTALLEFATILRCCGKNEAAADVTQVAESVESPDLLGGERKMLLSDKDSQANFLDDLPE